MSRALNHPPMHQEHHEAECEHVMWLEDIGRWRSEHRRAAAMLAQAQVELLDCDAALEEHAEIVRAHESRVQRHERAIADEGRGVRKADHDLLADRHQELRAKHDQAREAHQRIQAHHAMVTAEIERLSEKFHAAM